MPYMRFFYRYRDLKIIFTSFVYFKNITYTKLKIFRQFVNMNNMFKIKGFESLHWYLECTEHLNYPTF